MAELTGADLRAARFSTPGWGKRGYDPAAVHAFLAEAADALDEQAAGRAPRLSADAVHTAVFRKPRFGAGRGYDEDQVDSLLDRLEATLRSRRG